MLFALGFTLGFTFVILTIGGIVLYVMETIYPPKHVDDADNGQEFKWML
jgi:hypothetical protein